MATLRSTSSITTQALYKVRDYLHCCALCCATEGITVRNNRECTTDDIRGATRLLQILISEAAHLIWVLRCERAIQEKTHNEGEIEGRWVKAINRRLTNEKITATRIKRGKKFTRLVEATWEEAKGVAGLKLNTQC